jgi:hypothetical protein
MQTLRCGRLATHEIAVNGNLSCAAHAGRNPVRAEVPTEVVVTYSEAMSRLGLA